MIITMQATSKSIVVNGVINYLPMITARGDKGRMIGSRVPQGNAREYQTFTTSDAARQAAREAAKRCADRYPGLVRCA